MERGAYNLNPKVEQMIDQYRRVVGAVNNVFLELSARTEWEKWRMDGVGSCGISREVSETGLVGVAKTDLIELREKRNSEAGGEHVESRLSCDYHRKECGCVLGDLKAPICLTYVENWDELEDLGLNKPIEKLLKNAARATFIVLAGEESGNLDSLVDDVVFEALEVTAQVQLLPIIENRINYSNT